MKVSIGLDITPAAQAKIDAAIDELGEKIAAIYGECVTIKEVDDEPPVDVSRLLTNSQAGRRIKG